MSQERTRKIVITGIMGAIAIFLGLTRWGFIPWFSGASLTIMHVPVIIGAVLEGPLVGALIGLIFGLFSLIQAAVAPNGPADVWFTNPLLSVLPRLFIGPLAWLVWRALRRWPAPGLVAAGIAGSLTNSFLVLGMIGLLGYLPWIALGTIFVTNSLAEAAISAVIVLLVIGAWMGIRIGRKKGASFNSSESGHEETKAEEGKSSKADQENKTESDENRERTRPDSFLTLEMAYSTLGIEPGSSKEQIKAAFHKKAKEYHPDRTSGLGKEITELAEKKMKEINAAYDLLMKSNQ